MPGSLGLAVLNGLVGDRLERERRPLQEPITEVALVGHSMGGLVSRSACHLATRDGAAWVEQVGKVVSLGSAHLGAPLEQTVHVASHAANLLPETRMFSGFLRRRSSGIRDLHRGSLVDEGWRDRDPEAVRAAACEEVPLLEGATHCFVSATVTRSPRLHIGATNHIALLNHPAVYEKLREWLRY